MPDYLEELKLEDRAKDKERIKGFHTSLDNYKMKKESFENIMVQEPGSNEVDQKQSVVNFLASVVFEAEQLGINYEKLFSNMPAAAGGRPTINPVGQPVPPIISTGIEPEALVKDPENPSQYLKFSL